MHNKNLGQIIYPLVSLLILSCSSNYSNQEILSQIDSSITQANSTLRLSSEHILESLEMKAADVRMGSKAEQWLPIALRVDSTARDLLQYIDNLKVLIKEIPKSERVTTFFKDQGRASTLFKKLSIFKTKVVAVDSVSEKQEWPTFINSSKDSVANFRAFLQKFQSISPAEAQTFLSALQSDILRSEQQYLLYCLNATTVVGFYDEFLEAIVGQNAKVLQAGDELEITAGLGSFSSSMMHEISVAGKVIPLNERGLIVYKMKTPKRLGTYSLPVKVQFLDQDGKSQERTFTVDYKVVDKVIQQ